VHAVGTNQDVRIGAAAVGEMRRHAAGVFVRANQLLSVLNSHAGSLCAVAQDAVQRAAVDELARRQSLRCRNLPARLAPDRNHRAGNRDGGSTDVVVGVDDAQGGQPVGFQRQ
jgi:hypothetical protein